MKRTFHYLPPAPEEQRAFVIQFLGTLAALVAIGVLWFVWTDKRAVLVGAALGAIYVLGRSAWSLEIKARRAQNAEIALDDETLSITDREGKTQTFRIEAIEKCEVRGGRLAVTYKHKRVLEVGARELTNGMTLIEELLQRWAKDDGVFRPPSNFIPLDSN
jgi:hypothetical protein